MKHPGDIQGAGKGIIMAMLGLLLAVFGLSGCKGYEPESSEDQAERYYQQKYDTHARVSESHGLGNYGLFGYEYRGMEYVMSDGSSVVYVDDEGVFKDNAQAQQVEQALVGFAEARLADIEGALTPVDVELVGDEVYFETYEGEGTCWHEKFDGDVEEFLEATWPRLELAYYYSGSGSEGAFSYEMAYDEAVAQEVERAYLELGNSFDLRGITLAMVDPSGFEGQLEEQTLTLFDDALAYTVSFEGESARTLETVRFKPAFVEVAEGIALSSAVPGVTLSDQDVKLVPRDDVFVEWQTSDSVANAAKDTDLSYYVRNDTDKSIVRVAGIDELSTLCEPYQHRSSVHLEEGDILFMGVEKDIRPRIEVLDVEVGKVRVRYHTHFKAGIRSLDLRVIGMAYKEGSSASESTAFDARLVEETEDGWVCEVDVPGNAVPSNTLYFQFTYNHADEVTVQFEQEVELAV